MSIPNLAKYIPDSDQDGNLNYACDILNSASGGLLERGLLMLHNDIRGRLKEFKTQQEKDIDGDEEIQPNFDL